MMVKRSLLVFTLILVGMAPVIFVDGGTVQLAEADIQPSDSDTHPAALPIQTLDDVSLQALAVGQMLPTAAESIQSSDLSAGQGGEPDPSILQVQDEQIDGIVGLPDSGALAFSSNRSGTYDIYVRQFPDTTATLFIGGGSDVWTPVWSPEGAQMVYASAVDGDPEIFLLSEAGVTRQLTFNNASDFHPSWSPDGQKILFASNRGGYFQIFTMDVNGLNVQQIGVVSGNNALYPRFSPGGSRIAFMRASIITPACDWNWDVWVMDADGSNQRRVTQQLGGDLYPNWSPDGLEIIYARCEYLLTSDLYAINPDNGLERQLTDSFASNEWNGDYIAHGNYLAFNSNISGNSDIFVGPATGGMAVNITQNPAEDLAPSWTGAATSVACQNADKTLQPLLLAPGWSAKDTITADGSAFAKMLPYLEAVGYRLGCNLFYAGNTSASVTLYQNGKRILDTLCQAYPTVDNFKPNWDGRFDIIGHSFGGLRSRSFLETPTLYDQTGQNGANCDNPTLPPGEKLFVENLFTLGSPHGGGSLDLAGALFIGIPHVLDPDERGSVIELFEMDDYNALHHQPEEVCYWLIGGNAWEQTAMQEHWLRWLYSDEEENTPNDLGVYRHSAQAIYGLNEYPQVVALNTHDMHGYSDMTAEIHSYLYPDHTFDAEIEGRLGSGLLGCRQEVSYPAASPMALSSSEPSAAQIRVAEGQLISGTLTTGTFSLEESGPTAVFLKWAEGEMSLALEAPDGMQLTPDTAVTLPGIEYQAGTIMAQLAGYTLDAPLTGAWTYTVTAVTLPRAMPFQLTAVPDRPIALTAHATPWQPLNTPVVISASHAMSGTTPVIGATVQAAITRPDGGTDTLTLYDDGLHQDSLLNDGVYGNTYNNTTIDGRYLASLTATGSYQSHPYTRSGEALFTIAPNTVTFTGNYQDTPRPTKVPGLYNWLDVQLTVQTTANGQYLIAADLAAADGTHIAHALTEATLASGTHEITLSFYGKTINESGVDGPFTLTHLQTAEISNGTMVLKRADDVYVTAVYDHAQFGEPKTVSLPVILKP